MFGEVVLAAAIEQVDQAFWGGGRHEGVGRAARAAKLHARAEDLVGADFQVLEALGFLIVEDKVQFLLEGQERYLQPPAFVRAIAGHAGEMRVFVCQRGFAQAVVDALHGFDLGHAVLSLGCKVFATLLAAHSATVPSSSCQSLGRHGVLKKTFLISIVSFVTSSVCWCCLNDAARASAPPHSGRPGGSGACPYRCHTTQVGDTHEETDLPAKVMDTPDLQPLVHYDHLCVQRTGNPQSEEHT